MNILYHHRTRGQGVEAVHIGGVVSALRGRGHHVDVVGPPGVHLGEVAEGDGAPSAPSPSASRGTSLWHGLSRRAPEEFFELAEVAYNGWALPRLEARLAAGRYRLLYERYALFLVAGVTAAHRHRAPVILEVNDSACLDRIRPLRYQAAARRAEGFIWRAADAIVTVTDYFRDLIVDAGVAAARVHVIANAVDAAALDGGDEKAVRRRYAIQAGPVVGYLGALNRWRRVDLLVDAFAQLAPRHPRAHLLLVGDGPDRGALTGQVHALGLRDRVTFTGEVRHREVAAHLGAMDVAVLPHSNVYGSPMKLFEYLAAGRAVVAPRLPPVLEALGQSGARPSRPAEEIGRLFTPLDAEALALAIDGLLLDEAARAALGARGRQLALAEHLWSRHGALIDEIATELCDDEQASFASGVA